MLTIGVFVIVRTVEVYMLAFMSGEFIFSLVHLERITRQQLFYANYDIVISPHQYFSNFMNWETKNEEEEDT